MAPTSVQTTRVESMVRSRAYQSGADMVRRVSASRSPIAAKRSAKQAMAVSRRAVSSSQAPRGGRIAKAKMKSLELFRGAAQGEAPACTAEEGNDHRRIGDQRSSDEEFEVRLRRQCHQQHKTDERNDPCKSEDQGGRRDRIPLFCDFGRFRRHVCPIQNSFDKSKQAIISAATINGARTSVRYRSV